MKISFIKFPKLNLVILSILLIIAGCINEEVPEKWPVSTNTGIGTETNILIDGHELRINNNNYELKNSTRLYGIIVLNPETGQLVEDSHFIFYAEVEDTEYKILKAIPNSLGGNYALDEKMNTFSGAITEYNLNGDSKSLRLYEKGNLIEKVSLPLLDKREGLVDREYWEPLKNWDDANYNGRVSIFVDRYTDVYFDRNDNGIAEDNEFGYSRFNGGGWEYVEYGDRDYLPISNQEFHRHDLETGGPSTSFTHNLLDYGLWHTACRTFEYNELGNTGTKIAAVEGISHPVARGGNCPGAGYVFPLTTYYFSLPAWKPRAQRDSAIALEKAFDRLQTYFEELPCEPMAQARINMLVIKLDEFIKSEFLKIGGQASKYPPMGWSGEPEEFETNIGMTVPDC
ncbi:MAG: hypothetical protein V7724_12190 [Sediminicola sp.]